MNAPKGVPLFRFLPADSHIRRIEATQHHLLDEIQIVGYLHLVGYSGIKPPFVRFLVWLVHLVFAEIMVWEGVKEEGNQGKFLLRVWIRSRNLKFFWPRLRGAPRTFSRTHVGLHGFP